MGYIDTAACRVIMGQQGPTAPVIYLIDSPEHPYDASILEQPRACTVATVPVHNWGEALTPWPAPGLYREEPDFGGKASDTLAELRNNVIPSLEAAAGLSPTTRAICGYSLAGLFSLYAFANYDAYAACGCLSGSVWYEGWVDYLRGIDRSYDGKFAFLSLGTKEKRGGRPIMRTVQDNMEVCAQILQDRGCRACLQLTPGNHLQHVPERLEAGINALDGLLS
ncbi:MAG: alpha/beta hydrolase-fold protein [Coriobacteriales bacterium]|nr:alpha/beta hydrolase-fold protein [Coriobacteriales bacterium]